MSGLLFIADLDHPATQDAPSRESVWCELDGSRARLVAELEVGTAQRDDEAVDFGFGLDVWDLGEVLVARVASGWRRAIEGSGSIAERFSVSRDRGHTWTELEPSDARDLEHRLVDDARIARIDRWPSSWC